MYMFIHTYVVDYLSREICQYKIKCLKVHLFEFISKKDKYVKNSANNSVRHAKVALISYSGIYHFVYKV